ncbi:MAG: general secretion pathway protein [Gammaproteobacteria bacterium]|nr:MAG: general secretion pathway protein [Gammaproteobacteria bacterium]
MYLDYFGLKRPPFKITPDASMFYDGGARGNALDALIYAILNGEGIVKVVGEVGSGKTMLCRMLELKLPSEVEIVYIANPNISAEHILHTIAIELDINIEETSSRLEVMQKLQNFLLERHNNGYQIVVFVEEAQGMPIETLEEIRLMSNLETDQDKLLQIVLFGQPELDENLQQQNIRQLKERITHSFFLSPFTPEEVHKYLNFRMTVAGYHGPDIFSPKIAKLIAKHTGGLLRRINIVSDKVLLSAFAQQTHNINKKHVIAAVNDSEFSTIEDSNDHFKLISTALAASLAAIIILISYKLIDINNMQDSHVLKSPSRQSVIQNNIYTNAETTKTNTQYISDHKTKRDSNFATTSTNDKTNPDNILAGYIPEDTFTNNHKPADNRKNDTNVQPESISGLTKKPNNSQNYKLLSNLQKRLKATDNWLTNNSPDIYTIQLMSVKEQHINHLHKYLSNLSETILFKDIYIYQTDRKDGILFGVLYQNFSSKRDAYAALNALPTILNANSPVLRTIRGINGEISKSYGKSNL